MGGEGSGRRPGAESVVRGLLGFNQPSDTNNAEIYLPNLSGVQAEALKTSSVSLLTSETDPIFMGLSGAFLTDGSLFAISGAYVPMSISGGFAALSGALITDGIITATSGSYNTSVTDDNFIFFSNTATLANKTFNLANNTLTGTSGAFDTACSDGNFSYTTHTHPAYTSGAINAIFIAASGALIASGSILDVVVPFNCTLTGYTLLPNTSGAIIINVWKDTYANFPPTIADTLFSGGMILSGAGNKAQDNTLSTWNKTISTNDILRFSVSGASTSGAQVTAILNYTKP